MFSSLLKRLILIVILFAVVYTISLVVISLHAATQRKARNELADKLQQSITAKIQLSLGSPAPSQISTDAKAKLELFAILSAIHGELKVWNDTIEEMSILWKGTGEAVPKSEKTKPLSQSFLNLKTGPKSHHLLDTGIKQTNLTTARDITQHSSIQRPIPVHDNQTVSSTSAPTKNLLPDCPFPPDTLSGSMKQYILLIQDLKESEVLRAHPTLKPGGSWAPSHCRARQKVAIVFPFRDRQSHLNRLIAFLTPMLQRQLLDFRFIVTEQYGKGLFNKGRIMNAAFRLAESMNVDCVIFHDVDLFPQNDHNLYYCQDNPVHVGAYVNQLGYALWYEYIAGGVLAITPEQYRSVNGYSNLFWAWGGEDDDMGYRIFAQNLTILRPDNVTGRFTMLKHFKRKRTAPTAIGELLRTSKIRYPFEGVGLRMWRTLSVARRKLYFHMYVDVGSAPGRWIAK